MSENKRSDAFKSNGKGNMGSVQIDDRAMHVAEPKLQCLYRLTRAIRVVINIYISIRDDFAKTNIDNYIFKYSAVSTGSNISEAS